MLRGDKRQQILQGDNKEEVSPGESLAKVLWYYNLSEFGMTDKEKIVCPFHGDMNPSLLANYNDGSFFCFGCGLTGNAQRFTELMEKKYNKANDLQALQMYYKILKSKKCSKIKIQNVQGKVKNQSKQLYDEAHDFYYGLKTINWLKCKDEDIAKAKQYMKSRGFKPSVLNTCGCKYTYEKNYALIFPMLDNGEFKGWVCRTTEKDIEKRRKYLYNKGFSRATTLVGDYGKKDYVFVVEGYMDRLKFIQFGETNVVAILGWKMSMQQIQKLKDKGIKNIISALDNDVCGKRGTEYLKSIFKVTRFSYLKGIKDPGEMTQETFEKMHAKTMKKYKGEK